MVLFANIDLTLTRWGHTFSISSDPMGTNWSAFIDDVQVGSGSTFDDLMVFLLEEFGPTPAEVQRERIAEAHRREGL